jgi:hypothetical protein
MDNYQAPQFMPIMELQQLTMQDGGLEEHGCGGLAGSGFGGPVGFMHMPVMQLAESQEGAGLTSGGFARDMEVGEGT